MELPHIKLEAKNTLLCKKCGKSFDYNWEDKNNKEEMPNCNCNND